MSTPSKLLLGLLLILSFPSCTWQSVKDSFSNFAWRPHDYDKPMPGAKVTSFELSFEHVRVDETDEIDPYLSGATWDMVLQGEIRNYFIQEMKRAGILTPDSSDEMALQCQMTSASGEILEDSKSYRWFPLYLVTIFRDFPWLRVTLEMRCEVGERISLTGQGTGDVYARPFQDERREVRTAYERAIDELVYEIVSRLSERLQESG